MQSISGKKDWKHVFVQKVVTLNTCYDVAYLTFQLSHITTCFLRATDDNPQLAPFRATNIWRHAANLQSGEKMHFTIIVVTFLGGWASGPHFIFFWDNVNNQKYAWIILLRMTFFGFDVETRQSYAGGILLSERVRSIHLQRDRLSDRICRLVDRAYSWRNYGKLGWLE